MRGQVIGVNTEIFTPTGGNVGIAFAIPSDIARPIIDDLKTYGHVKRGCLGIKLGPCVTAESAHLTDFSYPRGVVVDQVVEGSGASKAGMQSGDIIVKVGGTQIESALHLRSLVSRIKPKETVEVTLWRKGAKTLTLTVPVGSWDKAAKGSDPSYKKKGLPEGICKIEGMTLLATKKIPPSWQKHLGWRHAISDGVTILKVDEGSAVYKKLQTGDIILAVGMQPLHNPEEMAALIKDMRTVHKKNPKSRTILLLIWRQMEGQFHYLLHLDDEENAS
jgi:serine protease Do